MLNWPLVANGHLDLNGYHEHFHFGWISHKDLELFKVADENVNILIEEKNYVKITLYSDFVMFKTMNSILYSQCKLSTTCLRGNPDTNTPSYQGENLEKSV